MSSQSCDILVVEDMIETVEGTLSELDLLGYTIDSVNNCNDANVRLRETPYRLVLIDLRLPDGPEDDVDDAGGLELISRLRRGDFGLLNQNAPYILMSAQEFRVERMEQRFKDADALERLHAGRVLRYQKGSMMRPIIEAVVGILGQKA